MMMTALVVDVSWYWVNSLRVQRAADAAALAGAVMLPNEPAQAYTLAYEEATKNGYPSRLPVSPSTSPSRIPSTPDAWSHDPRRRSARSSCASSASRSIGVTRTPKAEFTLPVPMGSPQNYYGVGFYEGRVATTTNVPGNTDWQNPALSVSGGQWSNPDRAFTNDNNYATETANNELQQWTTFDLTGLIPASATIDGLEVRLTDVSITGGDDTNCRVTVNTSWNGGTTWSSNAQTLPLSALVNDDRTVGSNANTTVWGGHSWVRADFSNGNFRVRLTWRDGITNCPAALGVQLDLLEVRVQFHTTTTTWTTQTLGVPDPAGGTLASQGFWGAIFTSGGWRENGDRYAPSIIGNGAGPPSGSANPDHDPNGYDYLIEVGGNGEIMLFDPIFCATGSNGHGGLFGAGDHWTSPTGNAHAANSTGGPVAVTYTLYDTNGTPGNPPMTAPAQRHRQDVRPGHAGRWGTSAARSGRPNNGLDPDREDCSAGSPAGAGHNQWVCRPADRPGRGHYRLNVNTSFDPTT